ncbi:tRNA-histidine guanylyltransferase [Arctopsyche grandis]|uniref:tRNA-histidine guanylyltransferase n=1 Tax=Arctopsyche grandis TaxID=121162 RepID=UPI00406D821E
MALTFRKSVFRCLQHIFTRNMANSKFEYVKKYEQDDNLLPNCWVVIRVDGKSFHKFADVHNFSKPNDARSLDLMNRAALGVMEQYHEVILSYGQSDEYSFVFKKDTSIYNRRGSKIMSTVTSLFTSLYVFHWSKHFDDVKLKYAPSFDGRYVLYPSDKDLVDYLSWRQADLHINNLYNTAFWNLVQRSKMTPAEAETFLCGTVAADKNEILFSKFNINYNNEPVMFKKGTILLRKKVIDPLNDNKSSLIVNIHEDMIQEKFWKTHSELLENKAPQMYELPQEIHSLILEQLNKRRNRKNAAEQDKKDQL